MKNRKDQQGSYAIALSNGFTLKGTYDIKSNGFYSNLYLIDKNDLIITCDRRFSKESDAPNETLQSMMWALHTLITDSKFQDITQPRIQNAAAHVLMQVFAKSSTCKNASSSLAA